MLKNCFIALCFGLLSVSVVFLALNIHLVMESSNPITFIQNKINCIVLSTAFINICPAFLNGKLSSVQSHVFTQIR